MTEEDFIKNCKPYFDQVGVSGEHYDLLTEILQPRVTRFTQIPEKLQFLTRYEDFDLGLFEHKKSKSTQETSKAVLNDMLPALEAADWNRDGLTEIMKSYAESHELKNSVVMWPVRIAAAGVAVTPGGAAEVMILLGKEETLRRIKASIARLNA